MKVNPKDIEIMFDVTRELSELRGENRRLKKENTRLTEQNNRLLDAMLSRSEPPSE